MKGVVERNKLKINAFRYVLTVSNIYKEFTLYFIFSSIDTF